MSRKDFGKPGGVSDDLGTPKIADWPTAYRTCDVVVALRVSFAGGRLIQHARYYWLLLAEGHLTRRLFGAMVRRIEALTGCPLGPAG